MEALANDYQYQKILSDLLWKGTKTKNRTGDDTLSLLCRSYKFDCTGDKIPLITTKYIKHSLIVSELIWMISGSSDVDVLQKMGNNIWNKWVTDTNKNLGDVYGKLWRNFNGFDQLEYVLNELKENPHSRRAIISTWKPETLNQQVLPSCVSMLQFRFINNKLDMIVFQRSGDAFIGVPFDICQYGLLLKLIAKTLNVKPGYLRMTFGDLHLYNSHIKQAREILERTPITQQPKVKIADKHILDIKLNDIKFIVPQTHSRITGKVHK